MDRRWNMISTKNEIVPRVFRALGLGGGLVFVLAACSLDASIIEQVNRSIEPVIEDLNRRNPDFIHGELVTTNNGYQFTAVFGETSEKKSLSNGWRIEGAFYE